MPTLICQQCHQEFHVKPSRANIAKFCSQGCYHKSRHKPKPILVCEHCGKPFEANDAWDAKRRKYCSRACAHEAQKERVIKTCRYCKKPFEVALNRQDTAHYCSKDCRLADGWMQSDPDKHSVFTCDWCGAEFEDWTYRQPRFCSAQCRSEFAAHQPKPNARKPENFVTLNCEWCGSEFVIHKSFIENPDRNPRFCSRKCYLNALSVEMRGENNPNYKGGRSDSYGPNWLRQRKKAVERDNHTCQACGYVSGGDRLLDVHHIRPFKEFGGDWQKANRLDNLIALCRACHAKVESGKMPCPQIQA